MEHQVRVAFLGTGLMGYPMAERLLKGGYPLEAYNRTLEKALPLQSSGGGVHKTPRAAVEGVEIVILMLSDAHAIESVLLSVPVLESLEGKTVLQMSTISSLQSRDIMEQVVQAGGDYMEAPVLGSTPQARQGALQVMMGGTRRQFERWLPLLKVFGPDPKYIGPVGAAAALKLALNNLIASLVSGFSLSLNLVLQSGIDADLFMDILRSSSFYTPTFDQKRPRMLEGDYSDPHFPIRHMLKDVELVLQESTAKGLNTAGLEGIRSLFQEAMKRGYAEGDYSGVFEAVGPGG